MTTNRKQNATSASSKEAPLLEAPVRWRLEAPPKRRFGRGMQIVDDHLWLFDHANSVYCVSLAGEVVRTWQLPESIEQLLVDGDRVLAHDRTGMLHDLSSKQLQSSSRPGPVSPVPRLLMHRGSLIVLGGKGVLTVHDARGKERWSTTIKGATSGGMLCADQQAIYVSSGSSVHALDWSKGAQLWKTPVGKKSVMSTWQSQNHLYAAMPREGVVALDKAGQLVATCPSQTIFASGTTSEDEALIFATGRARIMAWSSKGEKQWELQVARGGLDQILAHGDSLYATGFPVGLVRIDISSRALAASARQQLPTLTTRQATAPAPLDARATKTAARATKTAAKVTKTAARVTRAGAAATSSTAGVTVECFQDGKEVRVRVVSKGYDRDWACQFPRALRIAGARYRVDEVVESGKGGFYRVVGNVERLPARP